MIITFEFWSYKFKYYCTVFVFIQYYRLLVQYVPVSYYFFIQYYRTYGNLLTVSVRYITIVPYQVQYQYILILYKHCSNTGTVIKLNSRTNNAKAKWRNDNGGAGTTKPWSSLLKGFLFRRMLHVLSLSIVWLNHSSRWRFIIILFPWRCGWRTNTGAGIVIRFVIVTTRSKQTIEWHYYEQRTSARCNNIFNHIRQNTHHHCDHSSFE